MGKGEDVQQHGQDDQERQSRVVETTAAAEAAEAAVQAVGARTQSPFLSSEAWITRGGASIVAVL